MAHFAELNDEQTIVQVIVVNNDVLIDEDGNENENQGIAFCQSLYGANTNWKQTSYNGTIRGKYAGIGFTYNTSLDKFISPKCHEQAVLNELGDWDCDNEEHNG